MSRLFNSDIVVAFRHAFDVTNAWFGATSWVSDHFDEQALRRLLREGFDKLKGCQVELHLHDLMSVRGDVAHIFRWAQIAREEAEQAAR